MKEQLLAALDKMKAGARKMEAESLRAKYAPKPEPAELEPDSEKTPVTVSAEVSPELLKDILAQLSGGAMGRDVEEEPEEEGVST